MGDFQAHFRRPDAGIRTVEGNVAGSRAAMLERKRQMDQEAFEQRKRQITSSDGAADPHHALSMTHKFAQATAAAAQEVEFKQQTVGLVTSEQFKALQKQQHQLPLGTTATLLGGSPSGDPPNTEASEKQQKELERKINKEKKKKKLAQKKMMATLSFATHYDDEIEEEADYAPKVRPAPSTASVPSHHDRDKAEKGPGPTMRKIGKDPTVDTSFLPDKERESQNQAERLRLQQEWIQQQERQRQEPLEITYSYWDGSGHRRSVQVLKGDTIGQFLEKVRQDLCKEFRELTHVVAADALLYVKEDLILPQDLTFHDLILTQARGKSGPLFHFDVHEDVRLGPLDVRIEKDESHPGKVVERRWFERNKHIFPASRWEVYDPTKDYGKYTIGGGEIRTSKGGK